MLPRTASAEADRNAAAHVALAADLSDQLRRVSASGRLQLPPTRRKAASIRNGSRFCGGGRGHVANGVNAQGGLVLVEDPELADVVSGYVSRYPSRRLRELTSIPVYRQVLALGEQGFELPQIRFNLTDRARFDG